MPVEIVERLLPEVRELVAAAGHGDRKVIAGVDHVELSPNEDI